MARVFRLTGIIQGVGFRPHVVRLARRFHLGGWVRNDGRGVTLCLEDEESRVGAFLDALRNELPPAARIDSIEDITTAVAAPSSSHGDFRIVPSPRASASEMLAAVTPDLALCPDCRRELLDPSDRRFRYPFINCTNCGPRYSIVRSLPYDRERTTMADFSMCPRCATEYNDEMDRRFHAQPDACPICGPNLEFLDAGGRLLARNNEALHAAVADLQAGRIVAVKGLGGFHLFTDATCHDSVDTLRHRKHREQKPLAVMFPSLEALRAEAEVGTEEQRLLQSPAAPIVLLRRRHHTSLAHSIAPGNPWIGALLPYTPLHLLLLREVGRPLVATSANLSEEPLCTSNDEALARLAGIADAFLVHNREIARPVDDSVVRVAAPGPILLRRARGYAPDPIHLPPDTPDPGRLLCLGGHLKNTVAVTVGRKVILSPHIGDLGNLASMRAFERTIDLLCHLYGGPPQHLVCDLHPEYASTTHAHKSGLPFTQVQHHLAHVLACMLEHGGGPNRVLGLAWDGTGYGEDGSIWGGEFILVDRIHRTAHRVAHFRSFPLPGGDAAAREPARCLLGAFHAADLLGSADTHEILLRAFNHNRPRLLQLQKSLERRINSPLTSSAGRLFDAVAALLGLASHNLFEGQAAIAVEAAASQANPACPPPPLDCPIIPDPDSGSLILDWAPLLRDLSRLALQGTSPLSLALAFHQTLANAAASLAARFLPDAVALSGGCFQNALLASLAHSALARSRIPVLSHQRLSPNDNSIAAGQAFAAASSISRILPNPKISTPPT